MAVANGETKFAQANCPTGKKATGGGFFSSVAITGVSETPDGFAWLIGVYNNSGVGVTIHAFVVCA